MNPTECKYCGCDKLNADSVTMTRFRCGSTYWPRDEAWQISNGCAAKCASQLVEMRERVQRALKRLETATRFELVRDEYGAYMKGRDSWGNWLDVIEVEQAIAILKGEIDGQAD